MRTRRALARVACAPLAIASIVALSSPAESAPASTTPSPGFDVIALGTSGGIDESDLTAFLIGRAGSARYVLADAGSVVAGLRVAERKGALDDIPKSPRGSRAERALAEHTAAVLVSHPHLDHVSGLVIASPDDAPRALFALPSTIDALKADLFNNRTWVNFLDEGERPLKKYTVTRLAPGVATREARTGLDVIAYPLSHAGMTSTAFLLRADDGAHALYLGDTGPDVVEGEGRLRALWTAVAPLVRAGALRVVVIEVSYANGRADDRLYGHLTPAHLLAELRVLSSLVDATKRDALRGLPVVISHVKPTIGDAVSGRAQIARELDTANTLGVRFVHLQQGERARF